jgi:hypothetical protein
MVGVALLIRILAALLLLRLAFRFVANVIKGLQEPPRPEAPASLVRDRICNTFLPRDRAIEAVVTGKLEHFCSVACRDQAMALAAAR